MTNITDSITVIGFILVMITLFVLLYAIAQYCNNVILPTIIVQHNLTNTSWNNASICLYRIWTC
jgi:hypothetical protein